MDSKFLTGSLDMMILQVAQRGPTYGYEITQEVMKRSEGFFELKEGSLYPALHRLARKGMLECYWEDKDTGRRRRFYRLTAEGAKSLADQRADWERFVAGVNGVLGAKVQGMA
jgi:transcriptional regulator